MQGVLDKAPFALCTVWYLKWKYCLYVLYSKNTTSTLLLELRVILFFFAKLMIRTYICLKPGSIRPNLNIEITLHLNTLPRSHAAIHSLLQKLDHLNTSIGNNHILQRAHPINIIQSLLLPKRGRSTLK